METYTNVTGSKTIEEMTVAGELEKRTIRYRWLSTFTRNHRVQKRGQAITYLIKAHIFSHFFSVSPFLCFFLFPFLLSL